MSSARLLLYVLLSSCAAVTTAVAQQDSASEKGAAKSSASVSATSSERLVLTPLVMRGGHQPIPVKGGDARYHLVYELDLESFTGDRVSAEHLEVLNAGSGATVAEFDAAKIAARLVVRDRQAVPGQFGASQLGILYLHLIFDRPGEIPPALDHRLAMSSQGTTVSATAVRLRVLRPTELLLGAPLRGERFIAGDGCCDSTRHVRATLSLNGRAFDAQRFAIDWEQLDTEDRIYRGDPKNPNSYVIYGKPVYAVAAARVVAAVDGMANSPIGALPNLPVDKADGNHVILDLGGHRFALYAHFKPHTVQVHEGEHVHLGQILGMVGTSGNSSEPHLHFQVTDAPSALLSNGVPYLLSRFTATRRGASTAAFDKATSDGQPLETVPLTGPADHAQELPLDLWITDLP